MVPIFSLQDALATCDNDMLKKIAPTISHSIIASNNFLQLINRRFSTKGIAPYSQLQKPTFECLVIQEKEQIRLLLLDQEEAEYWRQKLREDRCKEIHDPDVKLGLYDIENNTIVSTGQNALHEEDLTSPTFKDAITQLYFLSGKVHYDPKERQFLSRWARSCGAQAFEEAFLHVHQLHGVQPIPGSDIEQTFFDAKRIPLEHRIKV